LLARQRRWRKISLSLAWLASLLLAGWAGYAAYNRFALRPTSESEPIQEPSTSETKRQREWIERLPKKVQEDLAKLPPAEREAQIKSLREQERQQEILWKRPVGGGPRGK
jgi:hypothetical protein